MRSRRAFTLVELLVVIGIIAVLIAILVPAVSGAKRHADRVRCASNLRQLAHAIHMYAGDNKGYFPSAGGVNGGGYPNDWIYWQSNRDFDGGALAPYLGRPAKPELFRCPSDDWTSRGRGLLPGWTPLDAFPEPYRYSYCMNEYLSTYPGYAFTQFDSGYAGTFNRVRQSSSIVMLLEVSERNLLTPVWQPFITSGGLGNTYMWVELLSIRHDAPRPPEKWLPFYVPGDSYPDSRGNVAFVDGHVDYVPRRIAHDPRSVRADHVWAGTMTWATKAPTNWGG